MQFEVPPPPRTLPEPSWFNLLYARLKAANTSHGFTGTVTTSKLTSGGTAGSMTFADGVLTKHTQAT